MNRRSFFKWVRDWFKPEKSLENYYSFVREGQPEERAKNKRSTAIMEKLAKECKPAVCIIDDIEHHKGGLKVTVPFTMEEVASGKAYPDGIPWPTIQEPQLTLSQNIVDKIDREIFTALTGFTPEEIEGWRKYEEYRKSKPKRKYNKKTNELSRISKKTGKPVRQYTKKDVKAKKTVALKKELTAKIKKSKPTPVQLRLREKANAAEKGEHSHKSRSGKA